MFTNKELLRTEVFQKPMIETVLQGAPDAVSNSKDLQKNVLSVAMLQYNSDFPTEKYNLGNFYYKQKDYEKAEKYLKKTIEKNNLNITNYSILLNFYIKNNYIEKAGKLIKEMTVKFPDNEDIKKIQLMLKEQ